MNAYIFFAVVLCSLGLLVISFLKTPARLRGALALAPAAVLLVGGLTVLRSDESWVVISPGKCTDDLGLRFDLAGRSSAALIALPSLPQPQGPSRHWLRNPARLASSELARADRGALVTDPSLPASAVLRLDLEPPSAMRVRFEGGDSEVFVAGERVAPGAVVPLTVGPNIVRWGARDVVAHLEPIGGRFLAPFLALSLLMAFAGWQVAGSPRRAAWLAALTLAAFAIVLHARLGVDQLPLRGFRAAVATACVLAVLAIVKGASASNPTQSSMLAGIVAVGALATASTSPFYGSVKVWTELVPWLLAIALAATAPWWVHRTRLVLARYGRRVARGTLVIAPLLIAALSLAGLPGRFLLAAAALWAWASLVDETQPPGSPARTTQWFWPFVAWSWASGWVSLFDHGSAWHWLRRCLPCQSSPPPLGSGSEQRSWSPLACWLSWRPSHRGGSPGPPHGASLLCWGSPTPAWTRCSSSSHAAPCRRVPSGAKRGGRLASLPSKACTTMT